MRRRPGPPSIRVFPISAFEDDGPIQQQRRCGRVLETTRTHQRLVHRRKIIGIRIKDAREAPVDIAECGQELERSRKQAFALKQLQQPSGPGIEEAVQHVWRHDRAGVDQQFCARPAREPQFSLRVARVAIGAGGESKQPAGDHRRLARKATPGIPPKLLQAFDVVVVNDTSSLRCRPLQAVAEAFADLSGEVLPAGKAVLARDHELPLALRKGQIHIRHLRPRTCNRIGVTSDQSRANSCLFAEGFERRTSRERLRRSSRPPFMNRLYPAETRLKEGALAHDSDQTGGSVPLPRGGGALPARSTQYQGTAVSMSTRGERHAKAAKAGLGLAS